MFCERREKWEAEDFSEVLTELEKKPLNRQLLSPIILAYLAGLLDGGGELGYLMLRVSGRVFYVPYLCFCSSREVLDFVLRQVGDGIFLGRDTRQLCLYVIGLRAVIVSRVLGPYLRGIKKKVANLISEFGYKLSTTSPKSLFESEGLGVKKKNIVLNGKKAVKNVPVSYSTL